MHDSQTLLELEALKQLKARYCRLLDAKDWPAWRELFTDDFHSDTAETGGKIVEGGDQFVAFVKSALGKPSRATVHQVHAPELKLLSDTEAEGIWAMEDKVRLAFGINMNGFGHYTERYRKVDGEWKISYSKLTRLREDYFNSLFSIYISNGFRRWLLARLGVRGNA